MRTATSVTQLSLRVDGAFEPWKVELSNALCEVLSLPRERESGDSVEDHLPLPRVFIVDADVKGISAEESADDLLNDKQYHLATLCRMDRITAEGWFQDVRHIEFDFDEDIQ